MTPETKDWIDFGSKAIIAIAAVYGAYRSNRNSKAIEVVRQDVNDKMQQFIAVTKTSAHAEGVLDEKEREGRR